MSRSRRRDKVYSGYHGVAEDHLRALDKLRKTAEGRFGRTAAPFEEQLRACLEAGQCPWCDAGPYKVLATHTLRAHAVNGGELREMAGLIKTASICAPEYSQERSRMQQGQRLPDVAYERAKTARRTFSEAGKAVQRAKLDAARTPEQAIAAARASAAKTAERNAGKHAEIVRLFGEGHLFQEIAKAVDMHPKSVREVLRRAGLVTTDGRSVRNRNADFRERNAEHRRLLAEATARKAAEVAAERVARFKALGETWAAVGLLAAEWAVSKRHAAAYLREHGAPVPDGRAVSTT